MGEVTHEALRVGWSGTSFSASARDCGNLICAKSQCCLIPGITPAAERIPESREDALNKVPRLTARLLISLRAPLRSASAASQPRGRPLPPGERPKRQTLSVKRTIRLRMEPLNPRPMGEVAREALRGGWSGTSFSASARDYPNLLLLRVVAGSLYTAPRRSPRKVNRESSRVVSGSRNGSIMIPDEDIQRFAFGPQSVTNP